MRDGILLLNKPRKWTSSDCVAICRRALRCKGIKKVGHGGTLDPMATGLLPIFVGQATRIMEYLELDYKKYRCTCKLGMVTDTLDIWGTVTGEYEWKGKVSKDDVRRELECFSGHIKQIPPKFSAVRVDGKRLYEYAYKGEEIDFEIKARDVHVKSIEIIKIDMESGEIVFDVECSKGTYIRTICSDLGKRLGCGCVMTGLERTATGNMSLESDLPITDPISIKEMLADCEPEKVAEKLESMMIDADFPLVHFGKAFLSHDRAVYFSRGNSIKSHRVSWDEKPCIEDRLPAGGAPVNARGRAYNCIYRVYEKADDRFLGTGFYDKKEGMLKADKVFVNKMEL